MKNDTTFKELKKSGYKDKTINQEIQANLIAKIIAKEPVFEGLYGYEDTVIPQLKKAIFGSSYQSFGIARTCKNKNCQKHGQSFG